MIHYLSTERFSTTVRYFVRDHRAATQGLLKSLTYEELFFERSAPVGHYIFTDFDRLSRYEIECAAAFARALKEAAPEARILNHPLKALERYPLLVALNKAGINEFTATRIECRDRPPRYPVFIRAEDGYGGPETDLLHNDDEYGAALDDLARRNLPLRGRIAIGFANEPDADGHFTKYGAFNIGGMIIPHDRLYSRNWNIKFFPTSAGEGAHDARYRESAEGVAAELAYMKANPHRDILARAFEVAGIDFGRADYGVVNGRVQIYEINTNPHLNYGNTVTNRMERRRILLEGTVGALRAVNTPIGVRGRVGFEEPRPRAHNLHWPRRRLLASLFRRALGR
jgi:hypothetical protein